MALQAGGTVTAPPMSETMTEKRGPGRPRKVTIEDTSSKRKRVVKNYPKCAYPGCTKNRFVRGKGFCGDHWRMWLAGKIKSAEEYQNPKKAAKTRTRRTKKK
jgi:hypothetical protein